ncbi:MAG: general stress protein [Rhodobacterales bacterium 32-66-7]|nr:MAG: general stress protein [Rhodobacterales bacterium 12-65-15]OYX25647.1 MAG: general stress protein [Rhodobacterales bacterium 32-66-7]OZA08567.1 MAG: general stress protein [Rhodobacterales bacterium 17-64-5]
MPTAEELETKLWAGLRSDRTVILAVTLQDGGAARPMTAIIEGSEDRGPLWFFTSQKSELAKAQDAVAFAVYVSKGHDLFARIEGTLSNATDRAMIDRLWNPFIAAWYEGKDDPDIALLRMDLDMAEIWENASSLLAGIKSMFGSDPQEDFSDKVKEVPLR